MDQKKQRILVVDDLKDWRSTLRGLLSDQGYQVEAAGSIGEALELLAANPFDLAMVDVRLDERNAKDTGGLTLAGDIQNQYPGLKVLIITGYDSPEIVTQSMKPGRHGTSLAALFLTKLDAPLIIQKVAELLDKQDY